MVKSLRFLVILIGLVALAGCGGQVESTEVSASAQSLIASTSSGETISRPRSITVSGSAEVRVAPDEIIITLGVETWNKVLATAKHENDAIVQKVLAVLDDQGIEDKHIQTDYLSIEPRYRDYSENREFLGYYVRKNISVTLKDVSKFEDTLSGVLEAGVNYVYGVEFRTTELRKHRDEARAMAIQAAREKAEAMAGELGQEIGAPLSIQEQQSETYGWYSWWGGSAAQNVVQNVASEVSGAGSTMALGQIPVNANVTVEFELK